MALLARGFGTKSSGGQPRLRENTPLDILGERYGRGEIDKAEFKEKRGDLAAAH